MFFLSLAVEHRHNSLFPANYQSFIIQILINVAFHSQKHTSTVNNWLLQNKNALNLIGMKSVISCLQVINKYQKFLKTNVQLKQWGSISLLCFSAKTVHEKFSL